MFAVLDQLRLIQQFGQFARIVAIVLLAGSQGLTFSGKLPSKSLCFRTLSDRSCLRARLLNCETRSPTLPPMRPQTFRPFFSDKRAGTRSTLLTIIVLMISLVGVYLASDYILANDLQSLIFIAIGIAGCAFIIKILNNWRQGLYIFFAWLFVEDFAPEISWQQHGHVFRQGFPGNSRFHFIPYGSP